MVDEYPMLFFSCRLLFFTLHCIYSIYTVEVERLWINLSNQRKEPLYEQIIQQVKQQIIQGELVEEQELPSIRMLAKESNTSVITVRRAYAELEREGYICTKQGKGCFVTSRPKEELRHNSEEEFLKEVDELLLKGQRLGFTMCEMSTMIDATIKTKGEDKQ